MLNSNFDLRKFLTESKASTEQIQEAVLTEATVMEYIRERMSSMNNEVRSCMREYLERCNEIDMEHEDAHAQLMNALEDFYNKLKAHFEEDEADMEEPLATSTDSPQIPVEEGEDEAPFFKHPENMHLDDRSPEEKEEDLDDNSFGSDKDAIEEGEVDEWGQGSGIYYKGDKKKDEKKDEKKEEDEELDEVKVKVSIPGQDSFEAEEGKEYSEEEADEYIKNAKDSEATPMNTKFEKINEGDDYEPRTKEDLVYQYLRDAWQLGAMKGRDVNPDEELSTMADSLLANLPDYDSAEKVEKPKEKSAFEKRLEKLAAAEKERRANLKEETLNENAGMYQPIVDGIMNLTNNKETALLIAGLVKTAVHVGTIPALAAALYVHKDKPLVRKVLDLPVMRKAIDFVKDED